MIKISFFETIDEECQLIKSWLPSDCPAEYFPTTIQETEAFFQIPDVLCVRTQSIIPRDWADQLRGILSRSQGYDHLQEYKNLTKTTIPLGYLVGYCSRAVAEHALCSAIMLCRKMKKQMIQFDSFHREGIVGREMKNLNALVVGVGRIGSDIARLCRALQMNVRGVDIVRSDDMIEYVNLDEGMGWADLVFCAASLTESSNSILNYDCFQRARDGVLFINVSRAEIAPMEDLARLLQEGRLAGLAQDVFSNEKELATELRRGNSFSKQTETMINLSRRPDVLFTPHNAFSTQESLKNKSMQTVDNIKYFMKNNRFLNQL